jgi:tetratricopeptide (TPR) repeat protein
VRGRPQDRPRRPEPTTAAEKRAAEVRATRAPRGEPKERAAPPPWEREQWVDDGPLRAVAAEATERAMTPMSPQPTRTRAAGSLDPDVVAAVDREAGPRAARVRERLTAAAEALGRGRFDDARRMVQPVLRDAPNVAMGHEIAGQAFYSTGQWRKAIAELETARELDHSLVHHPVLADCYRAVHRYEKVDELWRELKEASPEPGLMAEGRIIAAGALADRGDLRGALALMQKGATVPKSGKVREHHLRQWYVLGDLHDRAGDVVEARRFFALVLQHDADFADARYRLANLGR